MSVDTSQHHGQSFLLQNSHFFSQWVSDLKTGLSLGTEQGIVTFHWDDHPQPPGLQFLLFVVVFILIDVKEQLIGCQYILILETPCSNNYLHNSWGVKSHHLQTESKYSPMQIQLESSGVRFLEELSLEGLKGQIEVRRVVAGAAPTSMQLLCGQVPEKQTMKSHKI